MNPFVGDSGDSSQQAPSTMSATTTATTTTATTNSIGFTATMSGSSAIGSMSNYLLLAPPSSPVASTTSIFLTSATSPPPLMSSYSRTTSGGSMKSVAHRRTASREHQPMIAQQLAPTRIRRPVGIQSLQKAVLATVFSYLDDEELEQKIALVSKDWVSVFFLILYFSSCFHDRTNTRKTRK